MHIPAQDIVHVCLVNTGYGTPFISALELRHLKNTSYVTPPGSLSLVFRADVGAAINESAYRSASAGLVIVYFFFEKLRLDELRGAGRVSKLGYKIQCCIGLTFTNKNIIYI